MTRVSFRFPYFTFLLGGARSLEEWIQQYEDEHGAAEEAGGGGAEKLWDGVCSAFGWRERERLLKSVREPLWFTDDVRGGDEGAGGVMLPKVIHQTWKVSSVRDMPEAFASFHSKWRALNPDWSVKVWSDEDMLALVHKYYPKWRAIFHRGTTPMVVKADIFR